MWSMISNEIKSQIFCYKSGTFEEINHDTSDTAEDICKELCIRLKLPPLVQLLFGLRISGKGLWLAGCRTLKEGEKYEFRIRFEVPKLSFLHQLDKNTFDYFYHQVRHDVLQDVIPEIAYPNFKNDILGLCVSDMYVEMIEKNRTIDYYEKKYKNYIPKEIRKRHVGFIHKQIVKSLKWIKNQEWSAFYVKSIYLQEINKKAPNYLTENYFGTSECPIEDDLKQGMCRVHLQIAPYHPDEPGLRIYYSYKNSWKHVSKFVDFYTIQIDETKNRVSLEIQNSPLGFPITMASSEETESFVSCISGYYRLMGKWNLDLCSTLASPSLKFLTDHKIHGPIGGAYSYSKIEEKNSSIGSFIIRQCEKVFDTFYIDIVTKENQPETFKIHYKQTSKGDKWLFNVGDSGETLEFDDLINLAKSIPTNGQYFRLPPTLYDRSPLLLLCQTPAQLMAKETTFLRNTNPLLLRAADDLLLYKWKEHNYGDGIFTRMKADWKQPNGKKIDVTLKILKQSEVKLRLSEFVKLADLWSKLDVSEIVKMHGITLHQPISLVLESIAYGPFDELLRSQKYGKDIKLLDLVETSYSLAKALHFLQELQIVHGKIRCSSLQVTKFTPNEQLVVKLGDPGLPTEYTINDVPWIAIEDYDNFSLSRKNLKGDIWAYATTLWEIFSRGAQLNLPNPVQFFSTGSRPSKPDECAIIPNIYSLMKQGWECDPDKRFSPQKIFSWLLDAKTKLSRDYSEPTATTTSTNVRQNGRLPNGNNAHSPKSRTTTMSDYYSGRMMSGDTEHTYILTHGTTQAYIENCGSSIASARSNDGGSSQVSLINGNLSDGSQSTIPCLGAAYSEEYYSGIDSVLEFDGTRLIFQGEIGRGNYGCVFRGSMETFEDEKPVAIKCFKPIESNDQFKEFQREASMMKTLSHENIVKIYNYREDPLLIIMEYMNCGSLLQYLSINRPDLKVENLLNFAANIAKGMIYLEQKEIVHRDLAARNVLVANENCVKIADFGLAQFTDSKGYYVYSTNARALPLKWYAPETFEQKFSHKSDVWSYGVTLFEMFTFGESPNLDGNPDLNADQILELLNRGVRLECPRFCPSNVYNEMMYKCWNLSPKLRPSFTELLKKANDLMISNGEAV
ncbi:CLUMA_CG007500, isoform A [Clunio marinus]|uniref:CLUMA_CG007500, isoform A n=1 Tax=Clunio marinus TaxID=568069 RepID=A0A1J1I4Z3_9DIPT|nr:CLUMA_CG007500, isoform A [Clunio marinus]